MEPREMKKVFQTADRQLPIQEMCKKQTMEKAKAELRKQKSPLEKPVYILWNQLLYMDKSVFLAYGILACLELFLLPALYRTGLSVRELIAVCTVGAGILSTASIFLIDKLFFGKMAELGAACYFSTRQCAAAYMVAAESVNLGILFFMMIYGGSRWKIALLEIGLYILAPFLLSGIAALSIVTAGAGRRTLHSLMLWGLLVAVGSAAVFALPWAFFVTSLSAWGIGCGIMGVLFVLQLRRFFKKMETGEFLCMN